MTSLEAYFKEGKKAGCPADQMANFATAGIILQPRQLAASAAARPCDSPTGPSAIGYGGARGGGKSHWLLAQLGADDTADALRYLITARRPSIGFAVAKEHR